MKIEVTEEIIPESKYTVTVDGVVILDKVSWHQSYRTKYIIQKMYESGGKEHLAYLLKVLSENKGSLHYGHFLSFLECVCRKVALGCSYTFVKYEGRLIPVSLFGKYKDLTELSMPLHVIADTIKNMDKENPEGAKEGYNLFEHTCHMLMGVVYKKFK